MGKRSAVLGAGLETVALQLVIGEVFATDDWKAWSFAALTVGAIGLSSWQCGGLLHRWHTYEGPSRGRRALGWKALGFGLFATLALVAVSAIRILGRNADVTSLNEAALSQRSKVSFSWPHDPRVATREPSRSGARQHRSASVPAPRRARDHRRRPR